MSAELLKTAKENPWQFFSSEELSELTGLSVKAIRGLSEWGAPFVAKKSRPELLIAWISAHPEKLGKLE